MISASWASLIGFWRAIGWQSLGSVAGRRNPAHALCEELNQLTSLSRQELMDQRYGKYRRIGRYLEHPEMEAAATSDTLESSSGA